MLRFRRATSFCHTLTSGKSGLELLLLLPLLLLLLQWRRRLAGDKKAAAPIVHTHRLRALPARGRSQSQSSGGGGSQLAHVFALIAWPNLPRLKAPTLEGPERCRGRNKLSSGAQTSPSRRARKLVPRRRQSLSKRNIARRVCVCLCARPSVWGPGEQLSFGRAEWRERESGAFLGRARGEAT